jgi:hypothetical protein
MELYYLAAKTQNLNFAPRSRAAVARRAHNPKVTGSIPVFATKIENKDEAHICQCTKYNLGFRN